MTWVAGIFFVVARRLFALSPTLALKYPIKNLDGSLKQHQRLASARPKNHQRFQRLP
jgi:hypothetical protein